MQRLGSRVAIAAAVASLTATPAAFAAGNVQATVPTPGSLFAEATVDACENSPGPFITLSGELTLGGLNGHLIFRNNVKGTHTRAEEVTVDVTILEPGETMHFAKQPPEGGVGGNPWIFLQLLDQSGKPISDKVLLGRCVQGLAPANFGFILPTDADIDVFAEGCTNHPGPFITLEGELSFGGINGRLTFQNSRRPDAPHQRDEIVDVDFVILEPGETIRFAKQPPLGGVGGNPLIYFQFTDAAGKPLGGEFFLGRCVQLGR
jgi:hypothetical protein